MAIVCIVGENLRSDPDALRACRHVAQGRAAPPGVAGGVAPQHHVRAARCGRAGGDESLARRVFWRESGIVDARSPGRLRQDGPAGRRAGAAIRLRGRRHRRSDVARRTPRMLDDARWDDVDVAIDFTSPDAVMTNVPALARRGINIVLGTTGWQKHEAELRKIVADAGCGIVAAPNFSTGVVLFESLVARAAAAVRRPAGLRGLAARGPPRDEEGRAVRDGAEAETGHGRRRLSVGRSTCRRRGPGSFPERIRLVSTDRRNRLR